jgi:transposase-like protein
LSIVEPTEHTYAENAQESRARPNGSRRRRLSEDEKREIARLYAQTSTPTSEIRDRFGIGDSSLYRIVQREGLALRGRTPSSIQPNPSRAQAPTVRRRGSTTIRAEPLAVLQPRSTAATAEVRADVPLDGRSSDGRSRRAVVTGARTSRAEPAAARIGGAGHRFRIRFQGESVFEATDIRDALRQAEALGATEITAVARED